MSTKLFITANIGERIPLGFDFTDMLATGSGEMLIAETDDNGIKLSPAIQMEVLSRDVTEDNPLVVDNPAIRDNGTLVDMQVRLPATVLVRGDRVLLTVLVRTNRDNRFTASAEIFVLD